MNEVGQVIAWQLTKSPAIAEVELLLKKLTARLQCPQLLVYIDNCCSLRDKLVVIMGKDIIVKLDLFRAVQRITRAMPKKHPFFMQCMADLKLVFRQPNDLRAANSEQALTNLDAFVFKWEKCAYQEWNIITDKTIKQVSALTQHITKGCLSDIPPSRGTSRNEALHRIFYVHFVRVSRIGIPLALAILTVLYNHNC